MTMCLRIIGLCVSLSVFVSLLGFVTTRAVAGVCPCNYEAVPKNTACWSQPFPSLNPIFFTDITIPLTSGMRQECSIRIITGMPRAAASDLQIVQQADDTFTCLRETTGATAFCSTNVSLTALTQDEFEDCQCKLQEYATALNAVSGISVSGGPPYICGGCPTPIPALNQWGMIIMAGVLGLFAVIALFVMRRSGVVKPSN